MLRLRDIQDTRERINCFIKHTPLLYSCCLSILSNHKVYLKMENLQYTNSFKIRGATNFILQIDRESIKNGVIAASSGNHGQGVALACYRIGIPCTVVVPENAISTKVNAIKDYDANVISYGLYSKERLEKANSISREKNMTFVHGFNDLKVISGQGTIGLEILEDLSDVDIILVPIGGGGLISGIATAVKEKNPKIKIYGVEPRESNSMYLSLKNDKITELSKIKTIADGLRSTKPGNHTFDIVKKYVDDIILVEEDDILNALSNVILKEKLIVEPSGAVVLAALISGKVPGQRKRIIPIISGGNIDTKLLIKLLQNKEN